MADKSLKKRGLRAWTCTNHDLVYPTGGASVVVAETEERAVELLTAALAERGLGGEFDLDVLDLSEPGAKVLCDGDY